MIMLILGNLFLLSLLIFNRKTGGGRTVTYPFDIYQVWSRSQICFLGSVARDEWCNI